MLAERIGFAIAGGTIGGQRCRLDSALHARLVLLLAIGAVALRLRRRAGRAGGDRAVEALRGAAHVVEIAIGG